MNDTGQKSHPTEERLFEFAISGVPFEVKKHVERCQECADIVRKFGEIKNRIVSCNEEAVPEYIERKILRISKHGGHGLALLQNIIANPFIIAAAVALVVILLYLFVGSEVFRDQ